MVIDVSPLLRELILAAIDAGNDYPPDGAAARLMGVLLDRLRTMQPAPLNLPMPQDKRLHPITQRCSRTRPTTATSTTGPDAPPQACERSSDCS